MKILICFQNNLLLLCIDFRLTFQEQLHWELLPATRQDSETFTRAGAPCTLVYQHGHTHGQQLSFPEQTKY